MARLGIGSRAHVAQPKLAATVWTVTGFDPDRSFTWSTKSPAFVFPEVIPSNQSRTSGVSRCRFNSTVCLVGLLVALLLRKLNLEYMNMEAAGLKHRSEQAS
jgi:hypothetical protein